MSKKKVEKLPDASAFIEAVKKLWKKHPNVLQIKISVEDSEGTSSYERWDDEEREPNEHTKAVSSIDKIKAYQSKHGCSLKQALDALRNKGEI